MSNQNHKNADKINPLFEPFIQRVLDTQYFGVSRGALQLNSMSSSGKNKPADRFNFSIPYAGEKIEWTVMFNSNCPEMGPDFEFNNDSFLADPDVEMIEENIPSLARWCPFDRDCLLNVLAEFTQCYKQYQLEALGRQEMRLKMEYKALIEQSEICSQDVEVILLPNEISPVEARFFVRLAMDFSKLPGNINKPNDDDAMLVITFHQPNLHRITPQLFLTTRLEEVFGGPGSLQLPPYSKDKRIHNYIGDVKKIISQKIDAVVNCFEKKRNFIAAMIIMHRRNIVEYDAEDFSRISILLEQQDFYFFVHFQLSLGFPIEQPSITLQSVYHMTPKDEPCTLKINTYPYSPRWSPTMMITTALNKIIEKDVQAFKKSSASTNRRS